MVFVATGAAAESMIHAVFENPGEPAPANRIDELIFARLGRLGIKPANLCSDAVFLRRVYLDVTGSLPTAEEAERFLSDPDARKRTVLIDRLLQSDSFADYQALKWSDLLRVKAEFPINLWPNAAQAYHRWIRSRLKENLPYDRFARELLTESGSNFRVPQVNFYRALQSREPRAIAQAVALTFMGERAEKWPEARLEGMAGFFSQIGYKQTGEWKEEIVLFDAAKPAPAAMLLPDGTRVRNVPGRDPREQFAEWLLRPGNAWFARTAVNRVWYWLLGRGIIHEPDDGGPDNPPRDPELLAWLEKELVASHYDLRHVYRLILNSTTYQLSSIPRTDRPEAAAEFAFYPLRRLEAEVLADALCSVTGTTEQYSSAVPEPYTVMPEGQRAVSLPDGSVTSPFLELFGRAPRDTGLASERSNRTSAAQALHMLNSTHVQQKLRQGTVLRDILRNSANPRAAVTQLYLTILSRPPSPEEWKTIAAYPQSSGVKGREAMIDLAWALINTSEFLFRH